MTRDERIATAVREAIAGARLPDPIDVGVVASVRVDDGVVTIGVDLEDVPPTVGDRTADQLRGAALGTEGVEGVRIEGAADAPAEPVLSIDGVDRIVAVASAKGGVGKSTVATLLARGLADRGLDVGLFDADVHGPNVPTLLDVEGPIRADDDGRPQPIPGHGIEAMSVGLLADQGPLAWRGAMAHDALTDLVEDTDWTDRDVLIVDLPPGTGDVVLTTVQDVPLDGVVLVTTPFATSVDDTTRSAELFATHGIPVLGAVANMATFTCDACGHPHELFGAPEHAPGGEHASTEPADGSTAGGPGGSRGDDHDSADATADDPANATADAGDHDPYPTPDERVREIPRLCSLPFDRALQDPATAPLDPIADAVAAVRDHVESYAPPTVSAEALDLRGLPPRTVRDELVSAVVDEGSVEAVVDREPTPSHLTSLIERNGGTVADVGVDRLGQDRWLVRIR